jgi:hypothetical protein
MMEAIRGYAEEFGRLPGTNVNLADLLIERVSPELAAMVQYGGNESMSPASPERTIILKGRRPIPSEDGSLKYCCGLLSGEVIVLNGTNATLGKVCTPGIGKVR